MLFRSQNTQSSGRTARPRTRAEAERARRRAIQQRELRLKRRRIKRIINIIKTFVFLGIVIGCGRYFWSMIQIA